jgi:hypothetical protein
MAEHSPKRRSGARKPKPAAPPAGDDEKDPAAERAFVESLIASGQAAKPDSQGRLPPGATHEIVETENGELKVVRRRFSAY